MALAVLAQAFKDWRRYAGRQEVPKYLDCFTQDFRKADQELLAFFHSKNCEFLFELADVDRQAALYTIGLCT